MIVWGKTNNLTHFGSVYIGDLNIETDVYTATSTLTPDLWKPDLVHVNQMASVVNCYYDRKFTEISISSLSDNPSGLVCGLAALLVCGCLIIFSCGVALCFLTVMLNQNNGSNDLRTNRQDSIF